MEQMTLSITKRVGTGKAVAKRLRNEGMIPAVVYGGKTAENISVNAREFMKTFSVAGESSLVKLEGDGLKVDVLIKDYQENAVRGEITHIDFYEVVAGHTLKTHVPVHLTGNSVGVREGGLLEHPLHEVEIECLPKNLPHEITIDISELKIGASVHLSEVTPPTGVKFITNGETVVVHVAGVKAEVEPSEEDAEVEEASEE